MKNISILLFAIFLLIGCGVKDDSQKELNAPLKGLWKSENVDANGKYLYLEFTNDYLLNTYKSNENSSEKIHVESYYYSLKQISDFHRIYLIYKDKDNYSFRLDYNIDGNKLYWDIEKANAITYIRQ